MGDGSDYELEAASALLAVRHAASVCRSVQARRLGAGFLVKGDQSPVTVADYGSQAVVCRILSRAFPDDPVMGEEGAEALRDSRNRALADEVRAEVAAALPGEPSDAFLEWIDRASSAGGRGRFWCLDPIDGTKGFLRGEQYAVALALIVDGDAKVAALACPNLSADGETGCVLVARRGAGTESTGLRGGPARRVRASSLDDPSRARLVESVEAGHGDHGLNARIRAALGVAGPTVRMDSQAKYAVLARGDADVYLRMPSSDAYRENLWDQAAGALVIEEAGGRVTDLHGRPLDFTTGPKLTANQGIVASNGPLHAAVLGAIRSARS